MHDQARAAFTDAWGVEPVDIGVGGSIPFVAAFAERFPDAAILVTGVEDPDTRAHGANESLHLGEFERVCVAEAAAPGADRRHAPRLRPPVPTAGHVRAAVVAVWRPTRWEVRSPLSATELAARLDADLASIIGLGGRDRPQVRGWVRPSGMRLWWSGPGGDARSTSGGT